MKTLDCRIKKALGQDDAYFVVVASKTDDVRFVHPNLKTYFTPAYYPDTTTAQSVADQFLLVTEIWG